MFIDRKKELTHLEDEFKKNSARFIVIYGRRRIGKTTLIEEFLKNKSHTIYYTADLQTEYQQIEDFKRQILQYQKDEYLEKTKFDNWDSFFSYLAQSLPKNKKIILAIDEVTYLIKTNPAFPSILQKYWDRYFSKTKLYLILSGSLVSMMLKEILNYDSPLYGRRTSQINLKPFDFKTASKFMSEKTIEEKIKTYAIVGGVAKYLIVSKEHKTSNDLILNNFFKKECFFYPEAMFLLFQEFKNPTIYMSILKSISLGNSKVDEMANYVGFDGKKISRYLDILQNIGLIIKVVPITENPLKFRGATYKIDDNFLRFWFRFVFPNRSKIDIGGGDKLFESLKNTFNIHTSFVFEDICKQQIIELNQKNKLPINADKIGPWWHKQHEIDIVTLNDETKDIMFIECKWKTLKNTEAENIITDLKQKAKEVNWNNNNRKEHFAIIAKKIENKQELKKQGILAYDLDDF